MVICKGGERVLWRLFFKTVLGSRWRGKGRGGEMAGREESNWMVKELVWVVADGGGQWLRWDRVRLGF